MLGFGCRLIIRSNVRRLVITDRGDYQRVTLYENGQLIYVVGYSVDERHILEYWVIRGAPPTLEELRAAVRDTEVNQHLIVPA